MSHILAMNRHKPVDHTQDALAPPKVITPFRPNGKARSPTGSASTARCTTSRSTAVSTWNLATGTTTFVSGRFSRDNGITNNDEADIFFNFDRFPRIEGEIWMCPPFEERVVEVREKTQVWVDVNGLLAEVPLDAHDTIPHYLRASIVTPDDWKKVKAERFQLDHPARKMDIAALQQAHPADRDYPLGVWVGSMIGKIRDMLTLEGLAYAIHDYPLMVEDMVEASCQLVEQFLDQVLPHFQFDYAGGWEDICYRGGPLVSVKFFNRVVVPRYQRIHQKLAAHGIDIWWIDCDGDVRPILPGMMAGASTACSRSRSIAAPTRPSCCSNMGTICASWAALTRWRWAQAVRPSKPTCKPWCRWSSAAATSPSATTAARRM